MWDKKWVTSERENRIGIGDHRKKNRKKTGGEGRAETITREEQLEGK